MLIIAVVVMIIVLLPVHILTMIDRKYYLIIKPILIFTILVVALGLVILILVSILVTNKRVPTQSSKPQEDPFKTKMHTKSNAQQTDKKSQIQESKTFHIYGNLQKFGFLDFWIFGFFGILDCWNFGLLEFWNLELWNIGCLDV